MKKYVVLLFLLPLLMMGCKTHDWMDWRAQNEAWMLENMKRDSVHVTPTGLQYKVIRQGITSVRPDDNKYVTITYTGCTITGNVFDSRDSYTSQVSNFVSGFAEGLKKMNKSGRYILYIPYNLAYGASGSGAIGNANYIPPYSTLIFDVTLLDTFY